jgi:hypothetical protein
MEAAFGPAREPGPVPAPKPEQTTAERARADKTAAELAGEAAKHATSALDEAASALYQ